VHNLKVNLKTVINIINTSCKANNVIFSSYPQPARGETRNVYIMLVGERIILGVRGHRFLRIILKWILERNRL